MRARQLVFSLFFLAAAPFGGASADDAVHTVEPAAPASYSSAAQELADQALEYLGIPYRFGGTSPDTGLDCSGLVQNVFRNAVGLNLPRTAREMATLGDRVTRSELKPGDLVFFNTMRRAFSHVGIYLGNGQFVHAPSRGGAVRVESMASSYWGQRFNGARRLVQEDTLLPGEVPALH
jgi:cell wall-associated NlpC family hydrolase